jgi:hypothetical protein
MVRHYQDTEIRYSRDITVSSLEGRDCVPADLPLDGKILYYNPRDIGYSRYITVSSLEGRHVGLADLPLDGKIFPLQI